jgi:DNA-binding beta-propeller fold protein YncE
MLLRAQVGLIAVAFLAQGASDYRVLARFPVGGSGSWDYVTIDAEARRLYLSHATRVEVLDADSGKLIGTIPDTPGVHGIAIAHAFGKGFTTNGREDKVSVFNPADLKLIQKIEVGKGPDSIYYDAKSKRVFTGNHGSNDITAIDAEKAAVAGTVRIEGAAESMVTGKDGLIYVNLEDKNEVVVFDPMTLQIQRRMAIGVAGVPTGLAYDAKTNRLFIGCRKEPMMVVMDAASGKVVAQYPIGAGVDWASWDAHGKTAFTSSGDGTLNIFVQKSADKYEAEALKTQQSAKTMAFDPKTRKIFLPAGEFTEEPAQEAGKQPRRVVKPGTFVVLVVGK